MDKNTHKNYSENKCSRIITEMESNVNSFMPTPRTTKRSIFSSGIPSVVTLTAEV